tara:strand:- start:4258 stop:9825 length:5568 start_codon:yes stop_codon:yes gene_type:complete
MATCYNRNTVEYKALLTEYKNPLTVDSIITDFQLIEKTDTIPSLSEARGMVKSQTMLESAKNAQAGQILLKNLRNQNYLKKIGDYYFIIEKSRSEAARVNDRVKSFLKYNGFQTDSILFTPTKVKNMYRAVVNTNVKFDMNNIATKESVKTLPILDHLKKMFPGISYIVLNTETAKNIYNTIPHYRKKKVDFKNVNSFYFDGTAVLIRGRVTQATAIEEMLHPFVDALYLDNRALFDNLLVEGLEVDPDLAEEISQEYSPEQGFDSKDTALEFVTQVLTKHFNNEYDKKPISFLRAVRDLLNWFADAIKSLYSVLTGQPLSVKQLNSGMTLSDVAKMLNTDKLKFDVRPTAKQDVRYSLSPATKNILDKIKSHAATTVQTQIADQLFHQAYQSETEIEQLATSRVLENDGEFTNVDTGEVLPTIEDMLLGIEEHRLKGKETIFGKDQEMFFNNLAVGAPFDESMDVDPNVYHFMLARMEGMRDDNSIFLPNVIVSDPTTGMSYKINLLRVDPFGNLQIINVHNPTFSIKSKEYNSVKHDLGAESILKKKGIQDALTQRMYVGLTLAITKRILENLGFIVDEGTMTINLQLSADSESSSNVFYFSEGTTLHAASENAHVVDQIIPLDIAEENRVVVEEIMDQMRNPEEIEDWESEVYTEEGIDITTEENRPLYDSLFKALKDYREGLIKKEDAIKNARSVIMMDKSRLHLIRQISMSRSMIENSFLNPETIDTVYIDLVKESIDQIDEFLDYIGDPDNFSKPEYIKKVLAWQKFVESYRGLVNITNADGLSQTQLAYIKKLSDKLNDIVGILSSDKKVVKRGAIDIAIDNYVRQVIIDKSNRDFTSEELDTLMTTAKDIGYVEYQTGDMATSRDTILALMDKIYKRDRQIILDRTQRRAPRIKRAAMKLAKLTGSPRIDYSFMLEFDENGVPTGQYVKKKGKQFKAALNELKKPLINEDGSWKEFIDIEDLEEATEEQIKYNQDLYNAREKYYAFKAAERRTDRGPVDGKYFKYTDEFKRARNRFEVFVPNANGGGFWTKRASVTTKAYLRYVAKYYNTFGQEDKIARPIIDSNGNFTGQVYYLDNATFVKPEYKEINYDSVEGKKMISEKWLKLNNPQTELEKAQLEYYNMYVDVFENELLALIPENISMIGKIPVINGRPTSKLKDKPDGVGVLFSKMKTSVKNFFSPSTVIKKAFLDEHGDIITDSLPIYYTGSVVQQEEIDNAYKELELVQAKYKEAKTAEEQKKLKNELKEIRGKIKTLEAKPTARTLNLDLTESLIKFSAMAENYEVMSQSEDTFHAMIKVLENRTYTNSVGNVKVEDDDGKEVGTNQSGAASNMARRARKWMKMVYYNNDNDTKTFFDKLAKGIISQTSLAYVGFNVFGNLNNYVFGRVSNAIETVGGRFFGRKAMIKTNLRFQRAMAENLAGATKAATKKYRRYEDEQQKGKWNATVMYFRMLDSKEDMRESGYKSENRSVRAAAKDLFTEGGKDNVVRFARSAWDKFHEFGYLIQDAGEYNVQTKIGNAILESTTMKNSNTGETLSLWDALIWDNKNLTMKVKDGFDKVIFYNQTKERDWNDDARYELRNYIREVNKQVHGNYAHEDRMVMQSTAVGQLAAQFHKWVAPAIKARFRPEYFDENLGWMEGRYLTFWNFLAYSFQNLNQFGSLMNNYKEFNGEKGQMKLQNVFRTMGEIGIIMTTVLLKMLLSGMLNDDDDDERGSFSRDVDDSDSVIAKRLRNVFLYQLDRTHKDLVTFMPIPGTGGLQQMYQLFKSPIASSRTLGELGEALEYTVGTGLAYAFMDDESFLESKWVYQRPKARRGELKIGKQWGDALPILYTINRWKSYDNVTDFFIK